LGSERARAEESEAIVNWAFRQFAERTIVTQDKAVAEADIWMGSQEKVGLVAEKDISLLLPTLSANSLDAEVVYTGPIQAPVEAGQKLAELIIRPEGLPETRVPLVAETSVAAGGFLDRMMMVSKVLLKRLQDGPPTDPQEAS
jgi:D-alanyl-D-alanine carboxypeptidase (penicillin-binding protein 5/6)